ncbi:MAG: transaldolase family protein [Gammaproteobacteria bacterium]
MLELYLDTADLSQVARFNACLPVKGVTTNPTILAKAGIGLNTLLPALADILGPEARYHAQVVGATVEAILEEARRLADMPYGIVVKVPATEIGLAAIRKIKGEGIPVLATAIYSVQQGFLAALSGADYLAPYVNRIDATGTDGVAVVADLQLLVDRHCPDCKILPASFKNAAQAVNVLKTGVAAITLPADVAEQMLMHPSAQPAVERFADDWQAVFGDKRSFES